MTRLARARWKNSSSPLIFFAVWQFTTRGLLGATFWFCVALAACSGVAPTPFAIALGGAALTIGVLNLTKLTERKMLALAIVLVAVFILLIGSVLVYLGR